MLSELTIVYRLIIRLAIRLVERLAIRLLNRRRTLSDVRNCHLLVYLFGPFYQLRLSIFGKKTMTAIVFPQIFNWSWFQKPSKALWIPYGSTMHTKTTAVRKLIGNRLLVLLCDFFRLSWAYTKLEFQVGFRTHGCHTMVSSVIGGYLQQQSSRSKAIPRRGVLKIIL